MWNLQRTNASRTPRPSAVHPAYRNEASRLDGSLSASRSSHFFSPATAGTIEEVQRRLDSLAVRPQAQESYGPTTQAAPFAGAWVSWGEDARQQPDDAASLYSNASFEMEHAPLFRQAIASGPATMVNTPTRQSYEAAIEEMPLLSSSAAAPMGITAEYRPVQRLSLFRFGGFDEADAQQSNRRSFRFSMARQDSEEVSPRARPISRRRTFSRIRHSLSSKGKKLIGRKRSRRDDSDEEDDEDKEDQSLPWKRARTMELSQCPPRLHLNLPVGELWSLEPSPLSLPEPREYFSFRDSNPFADDATLRMLEGGPVRAASPVSNLRRSTGPPSPMSMFKWAGEEVDDFRTFLSAAESEEAMDIS